MIHIALWNGLNIYPFKGLKIGTEFCFNVFFIINFRGNTLHNASKK